MNDNPSGITADIHALPDHAVLDITGPDALRFAQAQFMNDVAALADGRWQWNGWLNPKGRLIALFALLRRDTDTLWLLLPDESPGKLAEALGTYVFRSKLKLRPRDDLHVSGIRIAPSADDTGRFTIDADGTVSLAWPGQRRVLISPLPIGAADADPHWYQADLRAGIPRLDAAQVGEWTPQQLSLERLQAYSVKKGCYPGQEIVARTHYLGQAKRGLRLLQADATPTAGSAVSDGERDIGQVIASADGLALAVVALDAEPRTAGKVTVRVRDFEAG